MSAKMDKNGGYDYQFVDKKKLPDECTCPICTLVQREAHQVICCGKIYCKSCLDELKSKDDNFNCPNCRSSLEGEHKYLPDKNMISKIRHFAIYCNNKDKGCQWEGLLKDFEEGHLQICPYQIIGCCNNCRANLQHQHLDWHLIQECPRRQFTCPFCKTCGEHRHITGDHITTCPDYILECPNTGCDERIKRSQIVKHRNECSKEIVPCHHSSIGCNTRSTREELPSHDKECMSSHLDLAVKKIHELKHRHDLTIRELRCDLDLAVKEIHELRAQRPFTANKIPVIKIQNVSQNNISPGFYSSLSGYKMALKITRSIGINCCLALLPGEYDDILEWPFQGEVTVELLNQLEDKDHIKMIIPFNKDTPDKYKNRVVPPNVNGEWWGNFHFWILTHHSLNDTAYFRVSIETTKHNKPWLV